MIIAFALLLLCGCLLAYRIRQEYEKEQPRPLVDLLLTALLVMSLMTVPAVHDNVQSALDWLSAQVSSWWSSAPPVTPPHHK